MTSKIAGFGIFLVIIGIFGCELFAGTRQEILVNYFGWLVLIGVATAAIASISLLRRQRRFSSWTGIIVAALGMTWTALCLTGCPGGVVARARAPDGTEMCMIETPGGETHQTGFYYHRPGKSWGWFYYEHEDSHWFFGHMRLVENGSRVVVYRFLLPVASFDIPNETFTILRWGRSLSPAQRWMPKNWKPEDALNSDSGPLSPTQAGAPTDVPPK